MAMTQSASGTANARFPYTAAFKDPVIDVEAIRRAPVSREPYTHMLVDNVLNAEVVPALRAEFPNITKPGFLTVDEVEMRGRFKQLIDELESPELSEVMSERMGLDLHPYPRLTTIRKISQAKDGRSHTDGTAKVMTLLVYMNDAWKDDGAGRLRVLYGPDRISSRISSKSPPPWAPCSPSCAPTIPGTGTRPSPASVASSRSPG